MSLTVFVCFLIKFAVLLVSKNTLIPVSYWCLMRKPSNSILMRVLYVSVVSVSSK